MVRVGEIQVSRSAICVRNWKHTLCTINEQPLQAVALTILALNTVESVEFGRGNFRELPFSAIFARG